MLQAFPPDVLAHILRLALGPVEEKYVGEGKKFLGVSFGLGAGSNWFGGLRRLSRSFREVLSEVPLHFTTSTASHPQPSEVNIVEHYGSAA